MSVLAATDLVDVAAAANRAPSVHNTQPTRWRLDGDGSLWLLADMSRRLKVGDPSGRDLRVSVGAALEGTAIALAERGIRVARLDLVGTADVTGIAPMVRIELADGGDTDPLASQVTRRLTWRKGFAPAPTDMTRALAAWAAGRDDISLVTDRAEIETISDLNERTSLAFYRAAPYRRELLSWMRLSASDPRFGVDGLSAPALGMSGFEALGAGLALRQPLFGILDGVGLLGSLVSERSRTLGAAAVVLFHRPANEHPIETGRALHRRQLELSALGFQTWPMSVLADDPEVAAELIQRYHILNDRRLITAWRVGPVPAGATARRERLPAEALVVTAA
jgi:hypothetical protein